MRLLVVGIMSTLLAGCEAPILGDPSGLPQGPPAFDGPVLEVVSGVGQDGPYRTLLVQAEPPDRWSGRILVTVSDRSELFRRSGGAARLTDLRVGATVSVWSRYLLESDPAQTSADSLVVE